MVPLCTPGSHVLNVVSGYGQLTCNFEPYVSRLRRAASIDELASLEFEPNEEYQKVNVPAYRLTKAMLIRATQLWAMDSAMQKHRICFSCVCPGWVQTDMGGPQAHRTVEQGAGSLMWQLRRMQQAPEQAYEELNGAFFRDDRRLEP